MRLIDADALFQHMNKRVTDLFHEYGTYDHYATGFDDALTYIMDAPIIDAVPVVHARWIHDGPAFLGGVDWYRCSICGNRDAAEWMKYCPTCGAKMDGGKDA